MAAKPFSAKSRRAVAMSRPRVASVRSACVGTAESYSLFTNRQLVCIVATMTPTTTDTHCTAPDAAGRPCCRARRSASAGGDVAYVDHGDARRCRAALFVHGVLVNADLWRNVIWDVADVRRCIAPDLPAHGATPVPAGDGGRPVPQRPRRAAR